MHSPRRGVDVSLGDRTQHRGVISLTDCDLTGIPDRSGRSPGTDALSQDAIETPVYESKRLLVVILDEKPAASALLAALEPLGADQFIEMASRLGGLHCERRLA